MTPAVAKELVLWMKENGIAQFSFDGLQVVFAPQVMRPTAPPPDKVKALEKPYAFAVEDVLPPNRNRAA